MLPMDKVELTAYRFLGGIGSCFTMFQSIIWLALSITGAACKYSECGATTYKRSFGHCFYLMYFYSESDDSDPRLNFITPYYFNVMMWISVILSLYNLIVSVIMLIAFLQWVNAILVKKIANVWTISIIIISIIECVQSSIFIYDITVIVEKDNSKCFHVPDITLLRSSYEPKPAPYLHELKQNLQKLKKKIRNLKKNLEFLDVVVDENNNPEHIDNPFIRKSVLSNHVKEAWHEMFNNSITDTVQYRRDFLPHDEVMKKFVNKKHIYLDDVDKSLLKSFDSLTNIKWIKPVENSNVAIGTNYHLNKDIDARNETAEINRMAILLHEYLKNLNESPGELIEADKMLDNVTKTYLEKLNVQMHDLYNKDLRKKFKKLTKEIAENGNLLSSSNKYKEEEILLYLKQFFNGLMSLEQFDDNTNEKVFQLLLNNTRKLFAKNRNGEIDNDQKVKNIKEYLKKKYDSDADDNTKPEGNFRRANGMSSTKNPPPSTLIKELCENCAFFFLWPSIVCMLLAIKTGLVWFLNVILVSLVLYYGDKIEIRRRSRLSSIIKYE